MVAVAGLVVGFAGGMLLGKLSSSKTASSSQSGTRQFARSGNQTGSSVMGQINAIGDGSITVNLASGGSELVFYSTTTPVVKSVEASSSDLTVGENIVIVGTSNSDGSVTANSIQLRSASQGSPTRTFGTGQ